MKVRRNRRIGKPTGRYKKIMDAKNERALQLLPIMNDARIAEQVGVSTSQIRRLRKLAGIKNPETGMQCSRVMDEAILGKMIQLKTAGSTDKKILETLGIHNATTQLKKYGIEFVNEPWETKIDEATLVVKFNNNLPRKQICAELGITERILDWRIKKLRALCVPIRGHKRGRRPDSEITCDVEHTTTSGPVL